MSVEVPFVDTVGDQVSIETILPGINAAWNSAVLESERNIIRADVVDYVRIAKFAGKIGIPFCVEANPYYRSPHAVLHEIGHWAVKPDAYISTYRTLSRRDFLVTQNDVCVDDRFGEELVLTELTHYDGNNDRMPDWDLPNGLDPTPNEHAVRAWTRHAIHALGISDPIIRSRAQPYETQGIGDTVIGKGSSFRTWATSSVNNPIALADLAAFGINPERGTYRPADETLILPYLKPMSIAELEENVHALGQQYPARITRYPGQLEDWREHVTWKYGNLFNTKKLHGDVLNNE